VTTLLRVSDAGWQAPGGGRILGGVTFAVQPGEFVALMGRNGAGKSTLLDLIAGIRRPTDGEILFDERPSSDWSAAELARTIAHLPQAVRADAPFSAEQLVLMGRYPHALRWEESPADRAIAERAMQQCGCLEFRHRRAATLSGGERQRVLLASCLAQQPRLFLLDEPATFLDIDHQFQCFALLRDEVGRGAACLAVTHDVNLALTFCTRLLVLAEGTVAKDVTTDGAVTSPDWLALFSPRLHVMKTPTGHPWVWYG
jgi:iron complex transport system ATP-binding protein